MKDCGRPRRERMTGVILSRLIKPSRLPRLTDYRLQPLSDPGEDNARVPPTFLFPFFVRSLSDRLAGSFVCSFS